MLPVSTYVAPKTPVRPRSNSLGPEQNAKSLKASTQASVADRNDSPAMESPFMIQNNQHRALEMGLKP